MEEKRLTMKGIVYCSLQNAIYIFLRTTWRRLGRVYVGVGCCWRSEQCLSKRPRLTPNHPLTNRPVNSAPHPKHQPAPRRSDKKEALPPPPLLRTARTPFNVSGSSSSRACCLTRLSIIGQALRYTYGAISCCG